MAKGLKLNTLVDEATVLFTLEQSNTSGLEGVLKKLNAFLMDCEALPYAVVDNVWQATKNLQNVLTSGDPLNQDLLSPIFEQLVTATDAYNESKKEANEQEVVLDPSVYTIPEDDIPLIEDFITESSEHLETAEAAMLELENDLNNSDTLNLIFRSFHTIKGMAGFMNLEQVGKLAHEAESLLDLARKNEVTLDGSNADAIFQALDMLKQIVDSIHDAITSDCVVNPLEGVDELNAIIRQCAGTKAPEKPAEEAVEEAPVEDAEPEEPIDQVEQHPPAEAPKQKTEERKPEAKVQEKGQTPITPAQAKPLAPKKKGGQIDEKIKVSTSRLDSLVNMVGELVIAQLMVTESIKKNAETDPRLLRDTVHQSKIIRELQELSMSMRMVPIGGIFQKMARMIRDMSRSAGKKIDLIVHGEQAELDRTIIDKLADPLIHMIRNSVDHGIEPPEERTKIGKSTTGHIELRAFHMAGNIVIEIEDDGRGINREKLLEKAIDRGLSSNDKNLTDQDVFSLIFHPGLSTAEKLTSVSGRGVGMDVVKRNIEELRGKIDINSHFGVGTTFTITLPLTLAIIDGQIVRVGDEKFIIPINSISKSFRPTPEQLSTVQGRGEMVLERNELLPLVRLHQLFDVELGDKEPTEGLVVLVEENNQACCILVDDLLDQQQIVIKSLGESLKQTPGISGGAIMGDGLVSLILDIPGIMKLYRS